jgi:hypothetical protein
MVCQLRPLTYSLGLKIAPRIHFTLVKLCVKNIWRFKQAVSRCKIAGAGFHSIAKLRAQIFNPGLAACTLRIATMKMALLRIAKASSLNLRAECQRPESLAGFVLGLRAGVGNPQYNWELIAKQLFLFWQTAALVHGSKQYSEIYPPPFYIERPPVWNVVFIWSVT